MKKKHDPLSGLDRSLQAETKAVHRRFSDADRFTQAQPQPPRHSTTVRDTFSFPEPDHQLLSKLQERCLSNGFAASKSELVRAGLHALTQMTPQVFRQAIAALDKIKRGRPASLSPRLRPSGGTSGKGGHPQRLPPFASD